MAWPFCPIYRHKFTTVCALFVNEAAQNNKVSLSSRPAGCFRPKPFKCFTYKSTSASEEQRGSTSLQNAYFGHGTVVQRIINYNRTGKVRADLTDGLDEELA